MATITVHVDSGRSIRRRRVIYGEVTLDGSNPSDIDLSDYMTEVLGGVVTDKRTDTPGLDPVIFTTSPSGSTLNVYAWKPTGSGDVTLVASTDSDDVLSFVAWGNQ